METPQNDLKLDHALPSAIIEQTINIIKEKVGDADNGKFPIMILTALKNRLEIEEKHYMQKSYIVGWDCGWEECGSNYRDKKDEKLIIDFETFYNKIKNEQ
jgi:hypothetical protein